MDKVFQHRFKQGQGISGHNLGNLLMVAMTEITGDFVSAIKEVSKVLGCKRTSYSGYARVSESGSGND
jgi:2-phospho-L-lactate transferase/gluconeogenesis factor (CofD/UPF0052 family)